MWDADLFNKSGFDKVISEILQGFSENSIFK